MVRNIRIAPPRRATLVALGATAALLLAACGGDSEEPSTGSTGTAGGDGGGDGDVLVGLITKENTNPFFVKMHEGAQARADELGAELTYIAGSSSADNDTQVEAIESLVAAGAKGILLTASDSTAIVPAVEAAKEAGVLVIALDTSSIRPMLPTSPSPPTISWPASSSASGPRRPSADAAATPRSPRSTTPKPGPVDVQRHTASWRVSAWRSRPEPTVTESDPRLVGLEATARGDWSHGDGDLLSANPDITVLYTINEPTASVPGWHWRPRA